MLICIIIIYQIDRKHCVLPSFLEVYVQSEVIPMKLLTVKV